MTLNIPSIAHLTNTSTPSSAPTSEIAQPFPPPSFKCEKCGGAFDDEVAAAADVQKGKGTEAILVDDAVS